MASSTLDEIKPDSRVFIDAMVFIYHFTGVSPSCRDFLARCEQGALQGITSTLVLAETTHRLMLAEAVLRGIVKPGNLVRKLRDKPAIVRQLTLYQEQVARIPLMGVTVRPTDPSQLFRAAELRSKYGLLTNDSLVLAAALDAKAEALASADADFEGIGDIPVYRPSTILTA